MRRLAIFIVALGLAMPGAAWCQRPDPAPVATLTDAELAAQTGKFLLPNGSEIAIAITSDTVLNGQLVLRSVFTVDHAKTLQVFGRQPGDTTAYRSAAAQPAGAAPSAIMVTFDRQSGTRTITPTFNVAQGSPGIAFGSAGAPPDTAGLTSLPLVPGGPAVQTADGVATLVTVGAGAQVTFSGDRFAVANLLGPSVATALVNSGSDRTIDTVTNVGIDLRDISAYQVGSAQLQIQALAIDATRGMVR